MQHGRDHGPAVRVLQTDHVHVAIEAALRLARAKFGPVLNLQGPVAMQRQAARIAAEAGLYIGSFPHIMQARRVS